MGLGAESSLVALIGGIGTPELLIILVVALIVLGPKRLPEIARMLGKALRDLRRATNHLSSDIREDLGDVRSRLRDEMRGVSDEMRDVGEGMREIRDELASEVVRTPVPAREEAPTATPEGTASQEPPSPSSLEDCSEQAGEPATKADEHEGAATTTAVTGEGEEAGERHE